MTAAHSRQDLENTSQAVGDAGGSYLEQKESFGRDKLVKAPSGGGGGGSSYDDSELRRRIEAIESGPDLLAGHGAPEGRVAAEPGTSYTDLDHTLGAFRWIKETGAGNTGWRVLVGDTGWYKIPSAGLSSESYIMIRRVNNTLLYRLEGHLYGTFRIAQNQNANAAVELLAKNKLAAGWRADYQESAPITIASGNTGATFYIAGSADGYQMQFRTTVSVQSSTLLRGVTVIGTTSDKWCTGLPVAGAQKI